MSIYRYDRKLIGTGFLLACVAFLASPRMVTTASAEDAKAAFDGEWRYEVSCAGCHGSAGEGVSAFGPPLKGNQLVLNAPAETIIQVIQKGRYNRDRAYADYPGMPAFVYIRAGEAEALVDYMKGGLQE